MWWGFVGHAVGLFIFFVPGRAARRAGVAARAWARQAGRAGPGTVVSGPGCAWAGPKMRAFGRAAVLRAKCPSISGVSDIELL
jgi:hypothetical protein